VFYRNEVVGTALQERSVRLLRHKLPIIRYDVVDKTYDSQQQSMNLQLLSGCAESDCIGLAFCREIGDRFEVNCDSAAAAVTNK
jgi:hypothetical protein